MGFVKYSDGEIIGRGQYAGAIVARARAHLQGCCSNSLNRPLGNIPMFAGYPYGLVLRARDNDLEHPPPLKF